MQLIISNIKYVKKYIFIKNLKMLIITQLFHIIENQLIHQYYINNLNRHQCPHHI